MIWQVIPEHQGKHTKFQEDKFQLLEAEFEKWLKLKLFDPQVWTGSAMGMREPLFLRASKITSLPGQTHVLNHH